MTYLYFIGDSKSNVGKSILSMLLADFLTQYRKKKIILVENDTSNPDVGKTFTHSDEVEVLSLSLDEARGIELVNYCEASDKDLVINSAARSGETVEKFAGTLIGSLEELHRQVVSFWVINCRRYSIELLKNIWTLFPVNSTSFATLSMGSLRNSSCLTALRQKLMPKKVVLLSTCLISLTALLKTTFLRYCSGYYAVGEQS